MNDRDQMKGSVAPRVGGTADAIFWGACQVERKPLEISDPSTQHLLLAWGMHSLKLANPYWSTHVRSQHPQQPFTTAANPKVLARLSSHLPVAVSRSGAVLMVTRIGMMPNCKIFSRQLASAASLATVCATSRRTPTSACLVRSSSACEQQHQREGKVNAARS